MKAMRYVVLLLMAAVQVLAADPRLEVQGVASVSAYEVGKPFDIALVGKVTEPWHAYYRNPATVGEAMQARMQAPEGFEVQGPFWQVPTLHSGMIGTAYVYEQPVVVWRVTPKPEAPASASFVMRAEAQLCSDEGCMPTQSAAATLELKQGAPEAAADWAAYERQVETLGDDAAITDVSARREASGAVLSFRYPGEVKKAYFFSDDNAIAPMAPQELTKQGELYELHLQANDGQDMMYPAPEGGLRQLVGMLTLGEGVHARVVAPWQAAAAASAETHAGVPAGLWGAVLGLFLGGLLLNLMPCVFPVLGLKVLSFVSLGGGSRARVVGHSAAFVLGILVSFWALGILLVAVSNAETLAQASWHEWFGILWGDAGAADRKWASWMEHEWVVYGIMLLLLVLGLWMYGVFELGARATGMGAELQNKGGYVGSFFQGLFVTVVATPCSAPYLGAAMPTAMSFPAVWMLVALTAMALGLALPYMVLGIFPSLARFLPRPGAWMESLKQGLSFFLFGAAVWMLDVYLSFVNGGHLVIYIALVVFCAAFWVLGRWCPLYRSRLSRWVGGLVALLLMVLGVCGSMPQPPQDDEAPEWVAWTPEAMTQALEEGSPVYVDFTAKWCATCQANKALAYSKEVYRLMQEHDVVLMRADKTQPNAKIDAELRRLERSAVPTNALYLPGQKPIVTRELLTPEYLLDFLKKHLPEE